MCRHAHKTDNGMKKPTSSNLRRCDQHDCNKRTIPLSYAGITQIRFKGTKA
ncbi:hypothetical protein J2T15_003869 [Paenibacillus harenae]|uniref:Uncharacterized protein n=1 Tax=Paenibacillus harenae TaxID=306543 RepID=A0ABT9U882_PAEHA|nr:hypothetical protein [Paenibacillus harenae]